MAAMRAAAALPIPFVAPVIRIVLVSTHILLNLKYGHKFAIVIEAHSQIIFQEGELEGTDTHWK
jgi:hypothetical protein